MSISLNLSAKDAAATGGPNFFAGISKQFKSIVKGIQLGRMIEALNSMSDTQLAELGVERKNIVAHAESLLDT